MVSRGVLERDEEQQDEGSGADEGGGGQGVGPQLPRGLEMAKDVPQALEVFSGHSVRVSVLVFVFVLSVFVLMFVLVYIVFVPSVAECCGWR